MKSIFFSPPLGHCRKIYLLLFTLLPGILTFGSCENRIIPSDYRVGLPSLPPEWENLLGPPQWRVEWINPDGEIKILEKDGSSLPELDIMVEWTTPVIAYPFWPGRGIAPGIFRPAGALFPFDVEKNRISLSWRGGVDAWVYLCLRDAGGVDGASGTENRQPHYFDWPRFRLLMESSDINEEVRRDPWLTDWRDVAVRTIQSGFDRRRIKPAPREELPVTIPQSGLYLGTSPFQEGRFLEKDETALFPVTGEVDTYVTAQGLLRCTQGVWLWIPRD